MSSLVFALCAAGFGACIGSFLNVVVHRLPQEDPRRRSLGGRSHCPACGAAIAWSDNVPVLGWVRLGGRARCCGVRISMRYPIVEALTAFAFACLVLWTPHPADAETTSWSPSWPSSSHLALLYDATFVSVMIAGAQIAWRHGFVPDALTLPLVVSGISVVAFTAPGYAGTLGGGLAPELDSIAAAVIGAAIGYGTLRVLRWLARRRGVEFGSATDAPLMGGIGAFLGSAGVAITLTLAVTSAALWGAFCALRGTRANVRLGAFLCGGAIVALFWGAPLRTLLFVRWPEWLRTSPAPAFATVAAALLGILVLWFLVRRGRGGG